MFRLGHRAVLSQNVIHSICCVLCISVACVCFEKAHSKDSVLAVWFNQMSRELEAVKNSPTRLLKAGRILALVKQHTSSVAVAVDLG